jgi:hypothetical protein
MDGKHTNTPAQLLERLQADGGRYLLSIALTPKERRAQPEPTYGGKGHSRWLTEEEHAALCVALSQRDALRVALQRARDDLDHLVCNISREDGEGMTRVGACAFAHQSRERADAALSTNATDGGVGK